MSDTECIEANIEAVNVKRYLDEGYSKSVLFKRAMMVFRSSYYGFESLADKSHYETKLEEYFQLMKEVFEQTDVNKEGVISVIDTELRKDYFLEMTVRVDGCKIDSNIENARLVVYSPAGDSAQKLFFDSEDNLIRKKAQFRLSFDELRSLRVQNKELAVEFQVETEEGNYRTLPVKLQLPYLSIHPEGYKSWFAFDKKVECRMVVEFKIKNPYTASRLSLTEHTHLIWHLFRYRLLHKENQDFVEMLDKCDNGHKQEGQNKSNQNYQSCSMLRPVNPTAFDAFWPTNNKTGISEKSLRCVKRMVRCHELELAYDEFDDPIEQQFCRCCEWCNVSAFYFYNPILRFLMVQFTNFYIRTNANLPSSYMCALSSLYVESRNKKFPVPLINLLNSVLEYMKISYSKKIQFLVIDVCSYKFIRSVDINDIVKQTENKEPFCPGVIKSIKIYFQVFYYLHSHIGKMNQIVPKRLIDVWYDCLYESVFKGYNSYLSVTTQRAFKQMKDYKNIPLFTKVVRATRDANYDFDMQEVSEQLDKIYLLEQNGFNVNFSCHPYLQIMQNIGKFIVEIFIPLANSEKCSQKGYFAVYFDQLLAKDMDMSFLGDTGKKPYFATLADPTDPLTKMYSKKLYLMFTLKLYSLAFGLQHYLINSIQLYNRMAYYGEAMNGFDKMTFLLRTDWIERAYHQHFPMENVFNDTCTDFTNAMDYFYRDVWPMKSIKFDDQTSQMYGALEECFKLCLWWKIDGKNLSVFRKIVETYRRIVNDCVARAENLFVYELAFIEKSNVCKVKTLVKDQLAHQLLMAVCFYIIKISFMLIRSLYALPDVIYSTKDGFDVDLTWIRPGLIDTLATLDIAVANLQKMRTLFIGFNDQYDFINRTINSTQYMVVNLYRDYYGKVIWQCLCQCESLIGRLQTNSCVLSCTVLKFNILVGNHICIRFHRQFRREFNDLRKKFQKFEEKLQNLKHFDIANYRNQSAELYKYEINSNGSMPYLSESLEHEIVEVVGTRYRNKTPIEFLKQFNIDVTHLT